VILVDSHVEAKGIDNKVYDPRSLFSYVMDLNLMDSFDSLLESNRTDLIKKFETECETDKTMEFWHIEFGKVDPQILLNDKLIDVDKQNKEKKKALKEGLNEIPTNFKISTSEGKNHVDWIERAVNDLISKKHPKLNNIRRILLDEK
jgi:hypothetical protein